MKKVTLGSLSAERELKVLMSLYSNSALGIEYKFLSPTYDDLCEYGLMTTDGQYLYKLTAKGKAYVETILHKEDE